MVAVKGVRRGQREYALIKHGQSYYYARAYADDPDKYVIMTNVSEKEGREIVNRSNEASTWGKDSPDEAET